ncbi:MAG: anhydro-N-acetylmuramic acid kinase, partial [Kiritimatiellae bacterium]|nr:anhydro-N-acetylmuramic acid kinase [Kiritimatiellia bacterium]
GAKNSFLVERIKVLLPHVEVTIAQDADYIEAMTFAWLAYKRIHLEEVALKEVTGARKNTLLGGLYA